MDQRSRWLPYLYAMFGLGRFFMGIVAYFTRDSSWRVFVILMAAPAAILLPLLKLVPESPVFLASVGRTREAEKVLRDVAEMNGVALPRGTLRKEEQQLSEESGLTHHLVWSLTTQTLYVIYLFTALACEWQSWMLQILENLGVAEKIAYQGLIPFQACELVAPLLISLLPQSMIFLETRWVLGWATFGSTLALIALSLSITYAAPHACIIVLAIIAIYLMMAVFVMLFTVTPSYFPGHLRGSAVGMCMSFIRLGSLMGPCLIGRLIPSGTTAPLNLCVAAHVVAFVAVLNLRPPAFALSEARSLKG